jgi:hypothetical protein
VTVEHQPDVNELSLWQALKSTVSSISDDFGRFVAANGIWPAVAAVAVLVRNAFLAAYATLLRLVQQVTGCAGWQPTRCEVVRHGSHNSAAEQRPHAGRALR